MNGGGARTRILGTIRESLDGAPGRDAAGVGARLADPRPGPVPARARIGHDAQVDLFVSMAQEAAATVARVAAAGEVPGAVAEYLAAHNLPPSARRAPDPWLDGIPWRDAPLLELATGKASDADTASVTGAFTAIAETGTLMLISGPEHPTTLNILPETHIVVLRRDQVVASYEDGWTMLRARDRGMPRTVTFVTGPSRSGDIEQTMQLGAHGPRRLHIVLIDGDGHGDGERAAHG